MKQLYSIVLCLILGITPILADETYTAEEQADIARRVNITNTLLRKHAYLEAMDSATYALALYHDVYVLRNIIRKNWDKAMHEKDTRLDTLINSHNLFHCQQRVLIYTYLVEINNNLNSVHLPLTGRNNQWVWQPDIQYWAGHLDQAERQLMIVEE